MSENTNTLFWVITGAVIVLAVFILIQTSQSDSLNKINNKFNDVAQTQIDTSYNPNNNYYNDRLSCGSSQASVNGYDVYVTGFHDNNYDSGYFDWHVYNNNDEYEYDMFLTVYIYTCETNELVFSVDWWTESTPPKETVYVSSYGPTIRGNWNYYVVAEVRPRW